LRKAAFAAALNDLIGDPREEPAVFGMGQSLSQPFDGRLRSRFPTETLLTHISTMLYIKGEIAKPGRRA
jgi:hypothetical protein